MSEKGKVVFTVLNCKVPDGPNIIKEGSCDFCIYTSCVVDLRQRDVPANVHGFGETVYPFALSVLTLRHKTSRKKDMRTTRKDVTSFYT